MTDAYRDQAGPGLPLREAPALRTFGKRCEACGESKSWCKSCQDYHRVLRGCREQRPHIHWSCLECGHAWTSAWKAAESPRQPDAPAPRRVHWSAYLVGGVVGGSIGAGVSLLAWWLS